MAEAGDVNGDGFSDVIIGAYLFDDGTNTDEGRAFVYYGSGSGLAASPGNTPDDANQAGAQFGIGVAGAGDVDGDGYSDVIIGANKYDDGSNNDEGRAYIYEGSSTGPVASPTSVLDDANQSAAGFGISVAGAGDVNGDGYSDVIVGANLYDGSSVNEGRAFVYHGSPSGAGATPASTPDDANQVGAESGFSVAGAGDVNGDGYSDVLVGVYKALVGSNNTEGKAYLYYGNRQDNVRFYMRLYNNDLTTPKQQVNRNQSTVGVGLYASSPLGRLNGRLVWEIKPNGQGFSGVPVTTSTQNTGKQPGFTSLGQTGTELKSPVLKVAPQNKLRVRVEYDKASAITGQVMGPWLYIPTYWLSTLSSSATALPVSSLEFSAASPDGIHARLLWECQHEGNRTGYEVERSDNGMDFRSIGKVDAKSSASDVVHYQFFDSTAYFGTVYYRLRLIDADGSGSYSRVAVLTGGTAPNTGIYPNPVRAGETLKVISPVAAAGTEILVNIYNSLGQLAFSEAAKSDGGQQAIRIATNSLTPGNYFVQVEAGTHREQFRLAVE